MLGTLHICIKCIPYAFSRVFPRCLNSHSNPSALESSPDVVRYNDAIVRERVNVCGVCYTEAACVHNCAMCSLLHQGPLTTSLNILFTRSRPREHYMRNYAHARPQYVNTHTFTHRYARAPTQNLLLSALLFGNPTLSPSLPFLCPTLVSAPFAPLVLDQALLLSCLRVPAQHIGTGNMLRAQLFMPCAYRIGEWAWHPAILMFTTRLQDP